MVIKVHRGTNQIGGCITEILTGSSRLFIDMGQNLPGIGDITTPEQDKSLVEGIIKDNVREKQAIVYTHGHEDHIGLFEYIDDFIPQYVSEGTKELLLLKYGMFAKASSNVIGANACSRNLNKLAKLRKFRTWKSAEIADSFSVGNITITPFLCSHSIYDSYMFLIEAEGKRIWHTGDYRKHGIIEKNLLNKIGRYATDIDVLITEGTMLGKTQVCKTEDDISVEMKKAMDLYKYVFVLASSTDIERLSSIKCAALRSSHPLCVFNGFMAETIKLFTKREGVFADGLYNYRWIRSFDSFIPSFLKHPQIRK